jgi:hypothetical protein
MRYIFFLFFIFMSGNAIFAQACNGLQIMEADSGTISDGSGAALYDNNLNCSWLIRAPAGKRSISLQFTEFDTEWSRDLVCVYEGSNARGRLLGTFSGYEIPPIVNSNTGQLFITFTSSATNTYQGWRAKFNCSPNIRYSVNASAVRPYNGTAIVTGTGCFDSNSVVQLTARYPSNDFVFLYWSENGIICGTENPLQLTVNRNRTISAVFGTRPTCYGTQYYNNCEGSFDDGSGNDYVSSYVDCNYIIQPPDTNRKVILLTFSEYQQMTGDYLTIFDGDDATGIGVSSISARDTFIANSGKMRIRFSSYSGPSCPHNSQGWRVNYQCSNQARHKVRIESSFDLWGTVSGGGTFFHNQEAVLVARPARGFYVSSWIDENTGNVISRSQDTFRITMQRSWRIKVHFALASTNYLWDTVRINTCSGSFDDASGENINYRNNINYKWQLNVPVGNLIQLDFTRMNTEACCDAVAVYDGADGNAPFIGNFRGNLLPPTIISSSNHLFLQFITNISNVADGWAVRHACIMGNTLDLNINNLQGGQVTGAGVYRDSATVTALATPHLDWRFTRWTEDGVTVSTNAEYMFRINSNRQLMAHFELETSTQSVKLNENLFTISPNPNQGILKLDLTQNETGFAVEILNLVGRTVYQSEIESGTLSHKITLDAPTGVYFVRLKNKNHQSIIKKIVMIR